MSDVEFDWDDEENENEGSEIDVSESSNEIMMSLDGSSEHSIDDVDPSSEISYPDDENHASENETMSDIDSIILSEPNAEETRMDYGLEWTDDEHVQGASEIEISSAESSLIEPSIYSPGHSSSGSRSETDENLNVEYLEQPESDSDGLNTSFGSVEDPPTTTFRVKIDENQNFDTRSTTSGLENSASPFINCPICFHNIKNRSPCSFACGHLMCGLCVNQMLDRGINTCSVCRKVFRVSDIRQLYPA
ncbi:uncharacterized protein LOC134831521 [Culicoides brevitarsis]|uniref:uncharacterized protein LOC134831521 n=1 Tax=Culicoides brevitarsis TaxID=469753 RepID=UPI00307C8D46